MTEPVCPECLEGLGRWYKIGNTGYFKECATCAGTGKVLPNSQAMVSANFSLFFLFSLTPGFQHGQRHISLQGGMSDK
jgi:hypothetical protein